jgi:hypothetical protein
MAELIFIGFTKLGFKFPIGDDTFFYENSEQKIKPILLLSDAS